MTREEQIAAAERIARENPEWTLALGPNRGDASLTHTTGAEAWLCVDVWRAVAVPGGTVRDKRGRQRSFPKLAAACRALGFTLNEPQTHG